MRMKLNEGKGVWGEKSKGVRGLVESHPHPVVFMSHSAIHYIEEQKERERRGH